MDVAGRRAGRPPPLPAAPARLPPCSSGHKLCVARSWPWQAREQRPAGGSSGRPRSCGRREAGQPWEPLAGQLSSFSPPLAHPQISSAAPFKAPSAAAKPVQAAFRRTPLRIQAARIGGVEVPNQKCVPGGTPPKTGHGTACCSSMMKASAAAATGCTCNTWAPCMLSRHPSCCPSSLQVCGVQPAVHLRHWRHHRQGHPGVHGRGEQAHQGGQLWQAAQIGSRPAVGGWGLRVRPALSCCGRGS